MGQLSNISGKEAVKRFSKAGYYLDHQEGSHMILYNKRIGVLPLSIPNHRELAPGLLRAQIKKANLSIEEFLQLKK